jgi:prevent-host-death family protein
MTEPQRRNPMATPPDPPPRTVTSKDAHRNWKAVTDKALRAPVVITAHGRPRHVLMAYDDYERLTAPGPALAGVAESAPALDLSPPAAPPALPADLDRLAPQIAALCRRYHVARLELFGSAARGADFDPARSDFDFLVTFVPPAGKDFKAFLDFEAALQALVGRPIDLVDRGAVEASRNPFRRHQILTEARTVYAAL